MKLLWFIAPLILAHIVVAQVLREQPPYVVKSTGTGYEVREYEAMTWVCTRLTGSSRRGPFLRLFSYIRGNNKQKEKLAMTIPVTTEQNSGISTMCFFLPSDYQASPPEPTSKAVFLEARPTMTVAVREFIGPHREGASYDTYLNPQPDWTVQRAKLRESLDIAGVQGFPDEPYYRASYSSPTVPRPRFEIWLPKA